MHWECKKAIRRWLPRHAEDQAVVRPLAEVVADLQARVAALGPGDPDFDMKKFTDEMWGDI